MSRIEVLLEAMKEANRREEIIYGRSFFSPYSEEEWNAAKRLAEDITLEFRSAIQKPDVGEVSYVTNYEKPNPALENVLAKLRNLLNNQELLPKCSDSYQMLRVAGEALTLGDLRRWAESEKGAGK